MSEKKKRGVPVKAWASFARDGSICLIAPPWKNKHEAKAWIDGKWMQPYRIGRVEVKEIERP